MILTSIPCSFNDAITLAGSPSQVSFPSVTKITTFLPLTLDRSLATFANESAIGVLAKFLALILLITLVVFLTLSGCSFISRSVRQLSAFLCPNTLNATNVLGGIISVTAFLSTAFAIEIRRLPFMRLSILPEASRISSIAKFLLTLFLFSGASTICRLPGPKGLSYWLWTLRV